MCFNLHWPFCCDAEMVMSHQESALAHRGGNQFILLFMVSGWAGTKELMVARPRDPEILVKYLGLSRLHMILRPVVSSSLNHDAKPISSHMNPSEVQAYDVCKL